MQVLNRSKSRKFRDKEKTLQEEEEALKKARHLEKLSQKNNLIKAEFEKHKKRLLLSVSDMSKTFEAQLNELRAINTKKASALEGLRNLNERLEEENEYNTISPNVTSRLEQRNTRSELYMSLGDTTNRMTSVVNEFAGPEALFDKVEQLKDTLENVDTLLKVEEETEGAVVNKLDELLSDNHLLSRDVNELRQANEHFDKRFSHLKEVEFAANAKYTDTLKDLHEVRELAKELKAKEKAFKKERTKEKETEEKALKEEQIKLSNILVALDDKKVESKEVLEELKKVEMKHEEMIERKKNTKTLAEFSELIENLYSFFFTPGAPKDALKKLIEPERKETPIIAIEDHASEKGNARRKSVQSNISNNDQSFTKPKEALNRDSFINRDFYLEKIEQFYDKHKDGPDLLVSSLIDLYQEFCFKETSLKKVYEGMQSEKLVKESQLAAMYEELGDPNHSIGSQRNNTGSQDISEGGIFTVNSQATTMNQAKFLFDTKKETDSDLVLLANTEKFILSCYLDTVEMVIRLGKMLISVADQAENVIPDRVRRLGKEILHHISLFKKGKKLPGGLDLLGSKEIDSITTIPTFTETDFTNIPDLSEAFQDFLKVFPGFTNKATEFLNRLKQDTMIGSFIKQEDVQNFLAQFQNEVDLEQEIEKVFDNIPELRKQAVENMKKRLDVAFSYYTKLSAIIKTCKDECMEFFNDRGQQVIFDADATFKDKPTEHVKNAMTRKWEIMLNRYEYDPNIDYRKNARQIRNVPSSTKTDNGKKLDEIEEEGSKEVKKLNAEELVLKLGEIAHQTLCKTGPRSYGDGTAYLSKTKRDEERNRQQIKLNKEKMKQDLYNMSEEEYLEFKRKQIGRGQQEFVSDYHDMGSSPQRASTSYKAGRYRSLDGIKQMIQTSKLLSKINILERSKSPPENLTALKVDILGNYIPVDPIYPKTARTATTVNFRRAAIKSHNTPGNLTSRANLGGTGIFSSRNSPTNEGGLVIPFPNDTEPRSSFRSNTTHFGKIKVVSPTSAQSELLSQLNGYNKSVSKMGDRTPDASPMFQAMLKKSQSQSQRLSKFGDLCFDTITIPLPDKATKESVDVMPKSQKGEKKQEESKRQVKGEAKLKKLAKRKPNEGLPKLKNSNSEAKLKKVHNKRKSMPEELASPENLSLHLNINSDSMIRGVYSSRWASSLPPSPLVGELRKALV